MALLRDNLDELGVLLTKAAAWYSDQRGVNILPVVMEKDFWVTEALRYLSRCLRPVGVKRLLLIRSFRLVG